MPDWVVGAITSSFYRDKQGRYCDVEGLPKGWKWGLRVHTQAVLGRAGAKRTPPLWKCSSPQAPSAAHWSGGGQQQGRQRMGWRNMLGGGALAHSGHLEGIHPGRNLGLLLSSRSVVSNFLWPHGLQSARLLCPWNFPDKNSGAGSHFLLQGIFLTQGSNPCLLHWQVGSLPESI